MEVMASSDIGLVAARNLRVSERSGEDDNGRCKVSFPRGTRFAAATSASGENVVLRTEDPALFRVGRDQTLPVLARRLEPDVVDDLLRSREPQVSDPTRSMRFCISQLGISILKHWREKMRTPQSVEAVA